MTGNEDLWGGGLESTVAMFPGQAASVREWARP